MSRQLTIESLENRTLLSAAQVNLSDFSSPSATSDLVTNGFGKDQAFVGGKLRLTTGGYQQSRTPGSSSLYLSSASRPNLRINPTTVWAMPMD